MSFFKDFKADVTQAMNELMPDGNEVLEDDSSEKRKPKKARSKKTVKRETSIEELLENVEFSDSDVKDFQDIAPEDMADQIDDMLDQELYQDSNQAELLLDDDLEVNTMDMSVNDLLSQLSAKQDKNETTDEGSEHNKDDESLEALLDSISDGDFDGASAEPLEVEERESVENDELNAALISDLQDELTDQNENSDTSSEEESQGDEKEITDSESQDVQDETFSDKEIDEADALSDTPTETSIVDEPSDQTQNEEDEELKAYDDSLKEDSSDNEPEDEANMDSEAITSLNEEAALEDEETPDTENEEKNDLTEEDKLYEEQKAEDSIQNSEDSNMNEEKDVISISSAEEKVKETKQAKEKSFNVDEADSETTYITKGTTIKGDMETDGSVDIIGNVQGNITCKGKVVVGGTVNGNITAGELYANGARIEGDIKSYGSVKVGVGTMIIGGIEGESAVIAGAVNGEIDVKGPVIVDSTAVIMGNIKSRSVQINNGAVIEGFCSQSYSDIDVKSFFA